MQNKKSDRKQSLNFGAALSAVQNLKGLKVEQLKEIGAEALKSKVPQAAEFANAVAADWKNDGDFNGLPVANPVAQVALGMGLRRAKNIEKKLEEKGVFLMAQMGLQYAKHQVQKWPIETLADRLPGPLSNIVKEVIKDTAAAEPVHEETFTKVSSSESVPAEMTAATEVSTADSKPVDATTVETTNNHADETKESEPE